MTFEEHKILAPLTMMRVGGPARFFSVVKDAEELADALSFAEEKEVPSFLLGEGSNIVVADAGFPGLVLRLAAKEISFHDYGGGRAALVADAGAHWDDVVAAAVGKNLQGIENLSLIPGTAGAAPVQNIGAYGAELAGSFLWAEVFDSRAKKQVRLGKDECGFGYRDSIFKQKDGAGLIITRVALALPQGGTPDISYKDVRDYFSERSTIPTIDETRNAIIAIRTAKLPDIANVGTVGSFFKNPIIPAARFKELQARYPDIPGFALKSGEIKIPLAWILDCVCGLKGAREGAVGTHNRQPLAIVNYGGATAREIQAFAEKLARAVKEKTGISPEYEVSLVGEWR